MFKEFEKVKENLKYKQNKALYESSKTAIKKLIKTYISDYTVFEDFDKDFDLFYTKQTKVYYEKDKEELENYFNDCKNKENLNMLDVNKALVGDVLKDKLDVKNDLKRIKTTLRELELEDDFNEKKYNSLVNNRKSLIKELESINKQIKFLDLDDVGIDFIKLFVE